MQTNLKCIFVMDFGSGKEKRGVSLFLMSNYVNGGTIYESGSNQGERNLERKQIKVPSFHIQIWSCLPFCKCSCQVGIWIFKSSSNGRICAGDTYWRNLST